MSPEPTKKLFKFGGSSLADGACFSQVLKIIVDEDPTAVVVSAMGGVTNRLIEALNLASRKDESYRSIIGESKNLHTETSKKLLSTKLLSEKDFSHLSEFFEVAFADLEEVLGEVLLSGSISIQTKELVTGFGEVWSAKILATLLGWTYVDARKFLVIENKHGETFIDWIETKKNFEPFANKDSLVITGFVARDKNGIPTTLPRNGSDLSASIFAVLTNVGELTLFTDVEGIYSADPRKVPEAVVLNDLSYKEAGELAYFGASVIHPSTLIPLMSQLHSPIPVRIRNTFKPELKGTTLKPITNDTEKNVKAFSAIDELCLLNLEGSGMVGVPGVSERLFGALSRVDISVVMISQASSEHSITLVVPGIHGKNAQFTVSTEFAKEIEAGKIQEPELLPDCTILAAIGENMSHQPGIAAKFFGSLAKSGINIMAMAQGSSERNISVVISSKVSTKALRAVHSGFYLADQTLSIGLIGPGLIGKTVLRQISNQLTVLKAKFNCDIRLRGILKTESMLLEDAYIDMNCWEKSLIEKGVEADLSKFISHIKSNHLPHSVIIDCSASDKIASHYPSWLEQGIHVVTPNKKAGSGSLDLYKSIFEVCRKKHTLFFYEATVGAGLPIISTLKDLVRTGDTVESIEGVFSGTLSYLFNQLTKDTKFSEIVSEARKNGFTEPDPRDDLSGMDVARKLIILAREMGLDLETSDIQVQSLVPKNMKNDSVDTFLINLKTEDPLYKKKVSDAEANDEVLRYTGSVNHKGKCRVELKNFKKNHPFAGISGSDNIVLFRTARYSDQPLVVQGPGAGPEVTAGGVFADLLRLVGNLK